MSEHVDTIIYCRHVCRFLAKNIGLKHSISLIYTCVMHLSFLLFVLSSFWSLARVRTCPHVSCALSLRQVFHWPFTKCGRGIRNRPLRLASLTQVIPLMEQWATWGRKPHLFHPSLRSNCNLLCCALRASYVCVLMFDFVIHSYCICNTVCLQSHYSMLWVYVHVGV
jgi:hypothetical protein